MSPIIKLKVYGALLVTMLCTSLSFAQEVEDETIEGLDKSYSLEEIVVTGRKREESLQDIPVSITVLGSGTLAEQNVLDQADLAELVPGLFYNQGNGAIDDQIAALPSIRGISSSEIATNRTKVSSFVDGMPILGSVGSINIGGATQVEVYSGPQSAAFGRSTFGGAINYVTADPGDEIHGSVGVNWSEDGTRILSGSVGGPINDTLGFQLGGSFEDSVSPDSDLYIYSDGVEAETSSAQNISARFVWTPTDKFKAKLTFAHDETDDGPSASFYATQESSEACFNSMDTFSYTGDMGTEVGVNGEFDCEFDLDKSSGLQAVNDISRYYDQNPDALAAQVQAAIDAGATDGTYSVEEAISLIADAYSIPFEDVGSQDVRDRISTQFDYLLDNGGALQLSLMKSEEEYIRQSAAYNSETPYDINYDALTGFYSYGDIITQYAQSDPTTIDESYAELRWASPAEERLRFVLGASYCEYEFVTEIYQQGGYNAVQTGIVDDIYALTGVYIEPSSVLSEVTENTAVFFNTSYDLTDQITASIEGRYASDKVGGILPIENISQYQTTNSFTPRIGLNFTPEGNTTYYLQYAVGVNPGGINANLLDPDAVDLLDNGVPVDLDPTDTDYTTTDIISVNYDSSDYVGYDEEKLTNYEFGFKGSAFDGRLSYTGALYYMIWEDAVQPIDLDWDYTYADNDLAGTLVSGTTDTYYVAETDDTSVRVYTNSGTSVTQGIELQANYLINDQWSINGNTSLMQAEYTDYCSADLYTGNSGDLGDYAGLEVGTTAEGDNCYILDGKSLASQPSFTLSVTPSYRTELSDGLQFNASARFQYTGSQYSDVANLGKIAATERLNLTFGLSKDAWSGTLYIENVFDDKTSTSGNLIEAVRYLELYSDASLDSGLYMSNDDGVTNYSHYTYDLPTGRTVGLRLNYNF